MERATSNPKTPLPDIFKGGFGVVSLYEMERYLAHGVQIVFGKLAAWEVRAAQQKRSDRARPNVLKAICKDLSAIRRVARRYGFKSVGQQCKRIIDFCEGRDWNLSCGEYRDDLRELRRRMDDELKEHFFLHLTDPEATLFKKPLLDWKKVQDKFGESVRDIEEMQKCFALNRYPAAVFHSMQIIEHGLIHLGKWLNVKEISKPGWNATTKELHRIARLEPKNRDEWENRHHGFILQMEAVSQALMQAWRHKIDHASGRLAVLPGDFAPEIAQDIMSAARVFMLRLVMDLPEIDPRS